VVAQASVWTRIGRSRVGFRHRGGATPHRPWPFLADSRQRAERFPAGSWPLRGVLPGFAVGVVAGEVSRGISGRGARGGSVVRFYQRAVLCEVGEDGADGGGFFDAGHDPHRAAAVDAGAHVDVDQIAWSDLEQPKGWPEGRRAGRPGRNTRLRRCAKGHRAALFVGAAVVAVGPSQLLVRRRTFAAPRWRQLRAQIRSRRICQVERAAEALDQRHRAALRAGSVNARLSRQPSCDHAMHDAQHRADGFGLAGEQEA